MRQQAGCHQGVFGVFRLSDNSDAAGWHKTLRARPIGTAGKKFYRYLDQLARQRLDAKVGECQGREALGGELDGEGRRDAAPGAGQDDDAGRAREAARRRESADHAAFADVLDIDLVRACRAWLPWVVHGLLEVVSGLESGWNHT